MKKFLAVMLSLAMVLAMTACAKEKPQEEPKTTEAPKEQVEVVVFAAASMTETLNEIAEQYKAVAPNVKLTFNFDSSGTLKTQIQEGADCDIFISAAQKQMNAMDATQDAEKNPDSLDLILSDTRVDLLENKVTLAVTEENAKGIKNFDDLAKRLASDKILLAMGNEDVPVGQYTQKILDFYKLSEKKLADQGKITYASNVKEVTTQVSEGTVDCGIIYCTDAFSAGLKVVDYATPEMCGQVIYPAALIKTTKHQAEAQAFLDYLQTEKAMKVFEKVGFAAVK